MVSANPLSKRDDKSQPSSIKTEADAMFYLKKYGYDTCENEAKKLPMHFRTNNCQINIRSMLKAFQTTYQLQPTGIVDEDTLMIMNFERCCLKDNFNHSKFGKLGEKDIVTWALNHTHIPELGIVRARKQIRDAFYDWTKLTSIKFYEVTQDEKADIHLAFVEKMNDPLLSGPDTCYGATLPSSPVEIHFDLREKWIDYDSFSGIKLRTAAVHLIGHALGFEHIFDKVLPMYTLYQINDTSSESDIEASSESNVATSSASNIETSSESIFETTTTVLSSTTTLEMTKMDTFVVEKGIIQLGFLHGGVLTTPFDDSQDLNLSMMTPCLGVEVFWYPDYLFAIRFIYGDENSFIPKIYHGDPSERTPPLLSEKYLMENGERINKITWYAGTRNWQSDDKFIRFITGIQFFTTAGRVSPLYGSNKDDAHTESFDYYTLAFAKGGSIMLIDELQFAWKNQEILKIDLGKRFTAFCDQSSAFSTLTILSAIYQSKSVPRSCSEEVTKTVRDQCKTGKTCTFMVTNEILVDDCPDTSKELQVIYTCSPSKYIFGPVFKNFNATGFDIIRGKFKFHV
ncbi:unnamed protein product [Adineta steineri]|uniref:Peptidase metallopeptidase domain-containing protein n=1 Tax=Adineta steineri TaxID=433720 RepID=A0A814ZYE9_9BILA|nr:unnamed protein product [Adineta steineri]CAF1533282.1 unnamed protein product [Adineta steineri]